MSYAKLQRPKGHALEKSAPKRTTQERFSHGFRMHGAQPGQSAHPDAVPSSYQQIQTKLKVGRTRDPAEHEADLVAAEVIRRAERPRPTGSPAQPLGPEASCTTCKTDGGAAIKVRRRPRTSEADIPAPADFESRIQQERTMGGSPLDSGLRMSLEPAFGSDLSSIRVHQGSRAAALTRQVNARAFTLGRDIFFDRGEYQPASLSGRTLIAHEVTHVIQQGKAHCYQASLLRDL